MTEENSPSKDLYRVALSDFLKTLGTSEKTAIGDFFRILALTAMNMRYERYAFESAEIAETHPYIVTREIVEDAHKMFKQLMELSFIGDSQVGHHIESYSFEEHHRQLWQEVWPKHSNTEFDEFVQLKLRRLELNDLNQYIAGKNCVDLGCGNGSFSFALLDAGAEHVSGVDFGARSLDFARIIASEKDCLDRVTFVEGDVRRTEFDDAVFDFAVSNGVAHHLGSEQAILEACREAHRVLRDMGWLWLYVDGSGAISMELWDSTVSALKHVDVRFISSVLERMGVSRNKMVHIVDGSNAAYIHSDRDQLKRELSEIGFGSFRDLDGGESTDLDISQSGSDPYWVEKFGCGDLRVLCQKLA